MHVSKIKSVWVYKKKGPINPLIGMRARSIDYFKLDSDLFRQKLENSRNNSFPHVTIMSEKKT